MIPNDKRAYLLVAILSPVLLLALWAFVTHQKVVPAIILPPPEAVFASLMDMLQRGYSGVPLATHVGASLRRVAVAFVLGSVLGTIVGLIRGRVPLLDAVFLVPSEVIRPIPPLGLIPLFILWFGIGELSKILLIFVSVFLIMMVSAHAGARSATVDTLRAARSMGANSLQTFRYVILPSALPHIMTGLRVALGTGLTILVASELLGGDRGLGFVILDASSFFRTTYVFAGIIIIGAIGLTSDRIIAFVERKVVHWRGRQH